MAVAYLQGGAQTTVTATMTELFPALWFNTKNKKPTNVKELEDFIYDYDNKSNKAYLDGQDRESGKKNIDLAFTKIEPKMKQVKLQNAYAITNYLFDTHAENPINYVVWGYRKKPAGVPENHSGDVFLIHKNKDITGVSLKAGLDKSMEPKLNTYVGTTLRQPYYKSVDSTAEAKLKRRLWKEVYSKIKAPKSVNESNYYVTSGERTSTNKDMVNSLLAFWTRSGGDKPGNPFDKAYQVMTKVCREELASIVNKNVKATKEWIRKEFRLQKEQEVPLIVIKAVGETYRELGDPVPRFLPKVTKVKAYLNNNSVQEWFIDLMSNKKKLTLKMTIRSDSGFRPDKPKGKLGKFNMLKLQYGGVKK